MSPATKRDLSSKIVMREREMSVGGRLGIVATLALAALVSAAGGVNRGGAVGAESAIIAPLPPGTKLFTPAPSERANTSAGYLLQRTLVNTGTLSSGPVAGGAVSLDKATRFDCSDGQGTCLYELQASVQVLNSNAAHTANNLAICLFIDNTYAAGCYNSGFLPISSAATMRSDVMHAFGVPRGAHKVQTRIVSSQGLDNVARYDLMYRTYTKR